MPFGKLHEFDLEGQGNWPAYVRLVEQFILLNGIKPELRVATLVTHVGAATYRLMCDLCAPEYPETKTFTKLVDSVKNHLEPKRSEIAERHIFRQRRQEEGESVTIFLQKLKHLATHCNFDSRLEEDIRDQFVSGLRSEEMRSRLFAEPSIDYKKAVELALALEAAERHAAEAAAGRQPALWAGPGDSARGADDGGGAAGSSGLHRVASVHAPRFGGGGGGSGPSASWRNGGGGGASTARDCWRCGKSRHAPNKCRYKSYVCDKCKVKGHLSAVCEKNFGRSKYQNFLTEHLDAEDSEEGYDALYNINSSNKVRKDEPYYCDLTVNSQIILFEIDTGSKISAISKSFYIEHFASIPIIKDNIRLQSYTGDAIVPIGRITVQVSCSGGEPVNLPLFVIERGGPPLLGRSWLRALKLQTINLFHINDNLDPVVIQLNKEFPEVFTDALGTFKHKIKLYLNNDTPIFCKARTLPLALRTPVEQELTRLENEGIIVRVERSDYGTPIVPVIKPDGTIRICGDYKITINPLLKDFHYPLPRIEQLFAALSGGEQYTKLDLKNAYMQLVLDESSQHMTAITTHVGVFVYRRAPFGIKCLPEIFQKLIEETLSGLDGVVAFIDDICVTGKNRTEHMKNLRAVLTRLKNAGLTIKFSKCDFFKNEVCYLGYRLNKHGLHTDVKKVDAIAKMPAPENISQLRAALGFINYYARFIPNISTVMQPLYELLKKGKEWVWSEDCEAAFCSIKRTLSCDPVLAHYDPALPLVLAVDSSAYGLGAVLSHLYPDGSERVVCCASRTLNDAERRYSQIDKEALAIVYGVTRHHQYLYGRRFTLRSDHKALSYIFGPKRGIPQTAASRLQRYAVRLAAYNFNIVFVTTAKNGNADGLSRLPQEKTKQGTDKDDATYLHYVEDNFPLSHKDVAIETKKDAILCKIYSYILSGWPENIEIEEEKAYFHRRENLHIDHGCIVWGYRVVVPTALRTQIINEIHTGHMGVVRMKQIARNYVWWPRLDAEIEARAQACAACCAHRDASAHSAPVPYAWPSQPWARLHADFLQLKGKYYFLVIDAHSKWLEVYLMSSGTSANLVIAKLREMFSRFGLPKQFVTDGGPPFTSLEFENFLKCNGVKHILTAPYHPSSNGAAENAVKTVKKVLKKATTEGKNIERELSNFLLQYRNSAHSTTQREPTVAMLGRRVRTRLDLLRGCTVDDVADAQSKQVSHAAGDQREVAPGQQVLVRDYTRDFSKWTEGRVIERTGAVTYKVKTNKGEQKRHIDQIIPVKKLNRYSLPILESFDQGRLNIETPLASPVHARDHWESAPSSPASASGVPAPAARPIPAQADSQSDHTVDPSISGEWVNTKPRRRGVDSDNI